MEKRGFTPLGYQGARIPVYDRWTPVERRVGAGRVFLVGDAAGQVKVSTVGGIVTGFRGAIGVSESIVNGGESRELRLLRRELDLHLLIRKTIHQFKQADYSRLVDLMNDSTRRSLSQYTRDEASRVLWNMPSASRGSCYWLFAACSPAVRSSQKSWLIFSCTWTHDAFCA